MQINSKNLSNNQPDELLDQLLNYIDKKKDKIHQIFPTTDNKGRNWCVQNLNPEGHFKLLNVLLKAYLVSGNAAFLKTLQNKIECVYNIYKTQDNTNFCWHYGQMGLVQIYLELNAATGNENFVMRAKEIVGDFEKWFKAQSSFQYFGLFDGLAGAIKPLVMLHQVQPDQSLVELIENIAKTIIDNLELGNKGICWGPMSSAKQPLTGLAYGTAGIGSSFYLLSTQFQNHHFKKLVRLTNEYEDENDWADYSADEVKSRSCLTIENGFAGIGLSRLRAIFNGELKEQPAAIKNVVKRIQNAIAQDKLPKRNDINDGLSGLILFLIEANKAFKEVSIERLISHLMSELNERLNEVSWVKNEKISLEVLDIVYVMLHHLNSDKELLFDVSTQTKATLGYKMEAFNDELIAKTLFKKKFTNTFALIEEFGIPVDYTIFDVFKTSAEGLYAFFSNNFKAAPKRQLEYLGFCIMKDAALRKMSMRIIDFSLFKAEYEKYLEFISDQLIQHEDIEYIAVRLSTQMDLISYDQPLLLNTILSKEELVNFWESYGMATVACIPHDEEIVSAVTIGMYKLLLDCIQGVKKVSEIIQMIQSFIALQNQTALAKVLGIEEQMIEFAIREVVRTTVKHFMISGILVPNGWEGFTSIKTTGDDLQRPEQNSDLVQEKVH